MRKDPAGAGSFQCCVRLRSEAGAHADHVVRQLVEDFHFADHAPRAVELELAADAADARAYLDRMSGRSHHVLSGLVVLEDGEERSGLERTEVVFRQLSAAEKERYVNFGEWRGRSGGYAIQTLGSTLVERLEGSVSNVVGLPVGLLVELAPGLFE